MKTLFLLCVATLLSQEAFSQNKKTTFYDSSGLVTSYELHWAQVVSGRFKSVYNRKENVKTLERTTEDELKKEISKTEKRITKRDKLGADIPDFAVTDIKGQSYSKEQLKGKVVVINYWFIGCAPCEMERPALNELTKKYKDNKEVVMISFARNSKEQLEPFLKKHPLLFSIIPTEKDYIAKTFGIFAYPATIILDREGRYSFDSKTTGIGILQILSREIDSALLK